MSSAHKSFEAMFSSAEGESTARTEGLQALAFASTERGAFTGVEKSAPRGAQQEESTEPVFSALSMPRSQAARPANSLFNDADDAAMAPGLEFAAGRAERDIAYSKMGQAPSGLHSFRSANDDDAVSVAAAADAAMDAVQEVVAAEAVEVANVEEPVLTPAAAPAAAYRAPEHAAHLPASALRKSAAPVEPKAEEKSMTAVWIVGGVVAAAGLAFVLSKYAKKGKAVEPPALGGGFASVVTLPEF